GLPGVTNQPNDGRNINNAPPALAGHRAQDALSPVEAGGEVGLDDVVPVLLSHAQVQHVAGDARVVDEDINILVNLEQICASLGNGLGVGDVHREGLGLLAFGLDRIGNGSAGGGAAAHTDH